MASAADHRAICCADCVSEAMSLTANNAPCHDLINSLRGSIPSGSAAANADMSTIKAAVANAPTPSSSYVVLPGT